VNGRRTAGGNAAEPGDTSATWDLATAILEQAQAYARDLQQLYQLERRRAAELERQVQALDAVRMLTGRLARSADLGELLEQVCWLPIEVLGAQACAVTVLNEAAWLAATGRSEQPEEAADDVLTINRSHGLPPGFVQAFRLRPGEGPAGRAVRDGRVVFVPDLTAEEAGALARLARRAGLAACLSHPLILPTGNAIGTLDTYFAAPPELGPGDTLFFETLANVALIGLRLERERIRESISLYHVGRALSAQTNLQRQAAAIVDGAVSLLGADGGLLFLRDTDPEEAPAEPASGDEDGESDVPLYLAYGDERIAVAVGRALAEEVARTRAPRLERDVPALLGANASPDAAGLASGLGSMLATPLLLDRRVEGVLELYFTSRRGPSQTDLWLLGTVANQAALLLRNAQLYLWSEELAIADERNRIAREAHDGVCQSLALKLLKIEICLKLLNKDPLQVARELLALREGLREDLRELRYLILDLRPIKLQERGLEQAVREYVEHYYFNTPLDVTLTVSGIDGLPPKLETMFYRMVQEMLTNVRKHARAQRAQVELVREGGHVRLTVRDDGCGFDVGEALARSRQRGRVGLGGMRERVEAAGGTLEIISAPGQGTTITAVVPLHLSA
jgi:signal transduction histidine kinase